MEFRVQADSGAHACQGIVRRRSKARINAAAKLSAFKSPDPTPQLRQLAKESKDAEVLAQAFKGLAARSDKETLPQFFMAMNHADAKVRKAAYAGVLKFNGGALPEDLEYNEDAPAEERALVARRLQEIHEKGPQTDVVAKVGLAPPGKGPSTKEPAIKEPSTSEPKEPTPTTPSPAVPSLPSYTPPPPFTPAPDNPVVTMLIWMCQAIAILVVIFEIAGAIGLVMGERSSAGNTQSSGKKAGADAEVPVEKNSTAFETRVGLLLVGATLIVALLTTAEMARLALRMEQKMDRMEYRMDYLAPHR